jgi:hypothetical protein
MSNLALLFITCAIILSSSPAYSQGKGKSKAAGSHGQEVFSPASRPLEYLPIIFEFTVQADALGRDVPTPFPPRHGESTEGKTLLYTCDILCH